MPYSLVLIESIIILILVHCSYSISGSNFNRKYCYASKNNWHVFNWLNCHGFKNISDIIVNSQDAWLDLNKISIIQLKSSEPWIFDSGTWEILKTFKTAIKLHLFGIKGFEIKK